MQHTLLGLAIIMIVALLSALVGPLFIDWSQYRTVFETEANRLLGVPVRVAGPIEVRLLPTPSMRLRDVEIGESAGRSVRARSLNMEFALGPLMRGQFRADQLHLAGPEADLGIDPSGRVDWPALSFGFNPEALSIDRVTVEDGRVTLADAASGTRVVLDRLWFNGEVRSLLGPIKGEGAFIANGELYGYRIGASRSVDGGSKIRVAIEPSQKPLSLEADGTLSLDGAAKFEGNVTVARHAGSVLGNGKTRLDEPWRATARVRATAAGALLEQFEFQYGPDERATKLAGTGEFRFGERPRLQGVLSARQLDLDRVLMQADGTRPNPREAVKALVSAAGGLRPPQIPLQLGLAVDAVTLGGATVQSLRTDLTIEGDAWTVDHLEFRAPGATQVQAGGRLTSTPGGLSFAGPASVEARDPRAFLAWLDGRIEASGALAKPLLAKGDFTLGSDRIAVERLRAEYDREKIEGRVVYGWPADGRPARLEAVISADHLDLDAAQGFAKAIAGGAPFERPREIVASFAVGRVTIGGATAEKVDGRLRLDPQGLQIERLSVADLGGASFDANGLIDVASPLSGGALVFNLNARSLDGVATLLARFAPDAAGTLRRSADRLVPARLQGNISLGDAGPSASGQQLAKLTLRGSAGPMRLTVAADASASPEKPWAAQLQLSAGVEADDGTRLAAAIGADSVIAVDKRPARLTMTAKGPLNGDVQIDARVAGGSLDASASGTARWASEEGPAAKLQLAIRSADLRPLRKQATGAGPDPLPAILTTDALVTGTAVKFENVSGTIAGSRLRGRLGLTFAEPRQVDGDLDLDAADLAVLLGSGVGAPLRKSPHNELALWSSEPFTSSGMGAARGQVTVRAARLTVTPSLVARQARGAVRFDAAGVSLEEFEAAFAGGRLAGRLALGATASGVSARLQVSLTGADAAVLIPGPSGRPPITGRVGLQLQTQGAGLSPAALLGSLSGSGTVSLENAQLANLGPKAFDTVIRAADQGLVLDHARIRDFVGTALDSGRLGVPRADAAFMLAAGQARIGTTIVAADGAELAVSGNVNVPAATLDLRVAYAGTAAGTVAGLRPEVLVAFKGPLAAPTREIEVSGLSGWLTLKSVELQAKRLEALELEKARRESLLTTGQTREPGRGSDAEDTRPRTPDSVPPPVPSQARPPQEIGTAEDVAASAPDPQPAALPPLPAPIDVRPPPGPPAGAVERKPSRPALQHESAAKPEPPSEQGSAPRRPGQAPPARAPEPGRPLDLLLNFRP